jgi:fructuronate reductase
MRLCEATLPSLPTEISQPAYERNAIRLGVVHLGVGAFHRAHQAATFDQAIATGDPRWGIIGASLRSPAVRDAMAPQDCLYSLVVRDGSEETVQVIGAIRAMLVAPERPQRLVDALASAETRLVTLTVTEKGYKLDPASGELIEEDPDVAADLSSLAAPRTAPGFLAAGLARRRDAGLAPFTAISCDNLPHNGTRLREAVLAIAERHDLDLRDWIERHGAFPETMVDRIVPATRDEDIARLGERIGVEDQAMVATEPFSQWVIEERFAGERPDFESVGVQLTASVRPWEEAKLRLLNGAHSAIAYLGGLAGITFVHEFVERPAGHAFVEALWDEAAESLDPPPGLDISAYRKALMARFENPALQHRTRQIAMDGSQKLPQRLLAQIAERLERGQPVARLALAVAAWMRWQGGRDDNGAAFEVDDPLAAVTARAIADARSPDDRVAALLSIERIFPARLAASREFREVLTAHLQLLDERGALEAVACA